MEKMSQQKLGKPGMEAIRGRLSGVAWRKYIVLGSLLAFVVSAYVALTQNPYPDPFKSREGYDFLKYPIERNTFKRLPVIGADIQDIHVDSGGERIWVVGSNGLLLHSPDGGQCWEPQRFPGGPDIPDSAIGRCRRQWWPSLPTLVSKAEAALQEKGTAGRDLQQAPNPPAPVSYRVTPDTIDVKKTKPSPSPESNPQKPSASTNLRQSQPLGQAGNQAPADQGGKQSSQVNSLPDKQPTTDNSFPPDLHSIQFIDAKLGWAVGDRGTIIATSDGGRSWQRQDSGTSEALTSVQFIDEQRGWAVGLEGSILFSTDGGKTWQEQNSGTVISLHTVQFIDGQHGWAVGMAGDILATSDGGKTWQKQNSGSESWLSSVQFIDGQHGWAIGISGDILATSDGGKIWQPQSSGIEKDFSSVQFIDEQRGWAVGESGFILATGDGGNSWQMQSNGAFVGFAAIQFIDDQHGWAVGRAGSILATNDGGNSWRLQNSGIKSILIAVQFLDDRHGWVVGINGVILTTTDGGNTWRRQESGTDEDLISVQFLDVQRGWAVGWSGSILTSTDGGSSWQMQKSGTEEGLISLHFLDDRHGWAVGKNGIILSTTNGGDLWQLQKSGTEEDLASVYFLDAQRGWTVGWSGVILATSDGGITWRLQKSGIDTFLFSVLFLDDQLGWAVGEKGVILATSDGGSSWQKQNSGTDVRLLTVQFLDNRHGWATGFGGTILATADGGATWTQPVIYRRYPAPWFIVVTALLILASLLALKPTKLRVLKQSIADMLATDRPLLPEDLQSGEDALGIGKLAEDLSHFLRNPSTVAPLTIAVTGEWGSGKSSLMNLLREDLKHHGSLPVWFNAWHHQKGEQLLASLFAHIKEQAVPGWFHRGGIGFRLRLAAVRGLRSWPTYSFWLIIFMVSIASIRYQIKGTPPTEWGKLFDDFLSYPLETSENWITQQWNIVIAGLSGLLSGPLSFLNASKGFGLKPSRLVTVNPNQGGSRGLDPGARARFSQEFHDVTSCLDRKMVVFIDDLDRCSKDNLIEILENVNLLTTSGNCFIVVGMSPEWVESCVALHYEELAKELADEKSTNGDPKESKRQFARNYLEKMINLEVPIPKLDTLGAAILLKGDKRGVRARPTAWIAARAPYAFLAAVIACGIGFGLSFPQPPAASNLDRLASWALDEDQLGQLNPGGPLHQIVSPAQRALIQSAVGQMKDHNHEKLEIALQADKKALEKGIEIGSIGNGEDAVKLVLKSNQSPKIAGPAEPASPVTDLDVVQVKEPEDKTLDQKPQSGGPLFSAQNTDTSGAFVWGIWLFALLGTGATVRAFILKRRDFTQDSPAFLKALEIWQPWIQARLETPRAIKRYLNKVRFIALRLRGRFSEGGTVALSSIYNLNPDWLRNPVRYEKILEGELSGFVAEDLNLDENIQRDKVQLQQLVEALSTSPRQHQEWSSERGDVEEGREILWPPAPEQREEVLKVLAESTLGL